MHRAPILDLDTRWEPHPRVALRRVDIGGGEPTVRPGFWELVDYATAHHVGVKFSINGVRITPEVAARLAASDPRAPATRVR